MTLRRTVHSEVPPTRHDTSKKQNLALCLDGGRLPVERIWHMQDSQGQILAPRSHPPGAPGRVRATPSSATVYLGSLIPSTQALCRSKIHALVPESHHGILRVVGQREYSLLLRGCLGCIHPQSGDTTPCRMAGVTLHSHVRQTRHQDGTP